MPSTVWPYGVPAKRRLQVLLAELLLVVRAQVQDERVPLLRLEAREVLLAEARLGELRQRDGREAAPSCPGARAP